MWDDWRDVEAAQRRADAEDAERYAGNVVRFPTAPGERPRQPETPVERVPTTPAPYTPPTRPRLDPADRRRGLAALKKHLEAWLERDR